MAVLRVDVKPELLRWACERAQLDVEALTAKFSRFPQWLAGEVRPTRKQLESFARFTHTPVGCLFMSKPLRELDRLPIPDLRTMGDARVDRPSVNLLETVYICQRRQEWYREFASTELLDKCDFVNSATLDDDVVAVADSIRRAIDFDIAERHRIPTWTDALGRMIEQVEEAGVLVMVNSVVGNNTHRRLDPEEFRGFALTDELAPLVFINGADTKSAQMFTLAHELAHLWLGETALSNVAPVTLPAAPAHRIERWCNQVAAELLVPLRALQAEYDADAGLHDEVNRLARRFKVSTLVILRRIHDIGALGRDGFREAYRDEHERLRSLPRGGGGNFYRTQASRVSRRFARALIVSTLEGHTLYRDAFRLLGSRKIKTFNDLGRSLGVL